MFNFFIIKFNFAQLLLCPENHRKTESAPFFVTQHLANMLLIVTVLRIDAWSTQTVVLMTTTMIDKCRLLKVVLIAASDNFFFMKLAEMLQKITILEIIGVRHQSRLFLEKAANIQPHLNNKVHFIHFLIARLFMTKKNSRQTAGK